MKYDAQYIVYEKQELQIAPGFRLYLATKLSDPKFTPQFFMFGTVIDFRVTRKELEEQVKNPLY